MSPERAGPAVAALAVLALAAADAPAADPIPPFSALAPGGALDGWRIETLRGRPATQFELVRDDGRTVLAARADGAVAALIADVRVDPASEPLLSWRWKIDAPLATSDLHRRDGDDYPARIYVFFDYDASRLPLRTRLRLGMARLLYGARVPAAALCYVWDRAAPVGTIVPNAYTDRVRMIVLRSGAEGAGTWQTETRDVAADFRAAFGEAPPPVSGVAVAADTDDTGETARAWFGDLRFGASQSSPRN